MQLHLYVPDDVALTVKARAQARGLSVSRYLAELVRQEVAGNWPRGFFDDVVGGWKGGPLTRRPQGRPERRDAIR